MKEVDLMSTVKYKKIHAKQMISDFMTDGKVKNKCQEYYLAFGTWCC